MQHHVFYLTFDGALHTCPAGKEGPPLRRVLDAGTGTGIWAMDFGIRAPLIADIPSIWLTPCS